MVPPSARIGDAGPSGRHVIQGLIMLISGLG